MNNNFKTLILIGPKNGEAYTSTQILGLNYGINAMYSFYNFSLVPAVGCESTFNTPTSEKSFSKYFGLGFGIKILNLYSPSN